MSGGGKPRRGGMGNKMQRDPEDTNMLNTKRIEI